MLRQARERRGETLSDVAHALKLSLHQVEALEQERFDVLPGSAFVRGFLRNFARHVHLDLDARIAALELGGSAQGVGLSTVTNASGEIPVGGEDPRKGVKPALVVVVAMAVVLGAGWYFDWFKVDEQPQVPAQQTLAEPAVMPAPLAEAPRLGGGGAPPLMSMPLSSGLATPALGDPVGDGPAEAALGSAEAERDAESATEEAQEGREAPVGSVDVAELDAGVGRLSFALRGESWIQVRDRDGVALYTGTNAPGSTRVVQGQPPFAIVVGNAALVSLEFNGQAVDLVPHTGPGGVARMTVE